MTAPYHSKALPKGAVLREWRLEDILGVGGFGIVYKAKGVYFDETVAIKEYFPGSVCDRTDGVTVAPTDSSSEDIYKLGLEKFVEEAKILWNLSRPERHPNIVCVRSLFEIHGTAYMVMDFEQGVSLSQLLKAGRRFEEAELLAALRAICGGLDLAHKGGVVHRDIKPANILIDEAGRPVLMDFGSARFDAGQATSTKVTFYTPPYAALEQYVKTYPQGPWTDVYALGVVLYQCVTGEKPPEVLERLHGGLGEALAARERPGFSRRFCLAVDAALAIRPKDRPQSLGDWLALFDADEHALEEEATRVTVRAEPVDPDATRIVIRETADAAPAPGPGTTPDPAGDAGAEPESATAGATAAPEVTAPEAAAPALETRSAPSFRAPRWAPVAAGVVVLGLGSAAFLLKGAHPSAPRPVSATTAPLTRPAAAGGDTVEAELAAARALDARASAAGRPARETAQLQDWTQRLQAAAAGKTGPATASVSSLAKSMAGAEADALIAAAAAEAQDAERAGRLVRGGAADGALASLAQARSNVEAQAQGVSGAPDGVSALRSASAAIDTLPAVASASAAAAHALAPALRAQVTATVSDAKAMSEKVIALGSGAKPWLFASQARKQAYQTEVANAARARQAAAALDKISGELAATQDLKRLVALSGQATAARQSMSALYSASLAASKAS